MNRTVVSAAAMLIGLSIPALIRGARPSHTAANASALASAPALSDSQPSDVPADRSLTVPVSPIASAAGPVNVAQPETETALMDRLRWADPQTVLTIVHEANRRFPKGAAREERDARKIDALVALDRIGDAHTDAMIFVQSHPSGPFSQHVMNLMGVHPRPAGAVPEPPPESN